MPGLRSLALLLPFLVVAACSDDPVPAPQSGGTARTPTPAESQVPQRTDRPFDPRDVELATKVVAEGFETPSGLAHAGDGSGRLFVLEQTGSIEILDRKMRSSGTLLDISDRLTAGGEQGLLGLAFHPRFADNGRLFVNYTDGEGDTVVSEFSSDGRSADPDSERALLTIDQPFVNHNGGDLAFGPDGYLYIATGDGGGAGDPNDNGQNLDTLLGKMLRVDVDARDAGEYGIPPDNPFRSQASARPEIWSYGLRNPWQFSFDRATGDLWIADVGQGAFEEIDREPAGAPGGVNYGWRVAEGFGCFEESDCDRSGLEPPIAVYSHDLGCAITGGFVYRGRDFPALRGAYITGDYCSGNVWALPADVEDAEDPRPTLSTEFNISSFGEDERGELYVSDHTGGRIVQIVDRS